MDSIQKNCVSVSKMLQETFLQSFLKNYVQVHQEQKLSYFKRKGCSHQMLI